MSKISPCLWFDTEAEAAARFYVETFRACGQTASLGDTLLYGEAFPNREGSVLTIGFTLAGQDFIALNGGSSFQITPAVSMFVSCADQAEIDAFWERFLDGGTVQQCGWITDRFGLSWQIVPAALKRMTHDPDKARAARVMQAMMGMVKLDLASLEAAYRGEA